MNSDTHAAANKSFFLIKLVGWIQLVLQLNVTHNIWFGVEHDCSCSTSEESI